MSNRITFSDQQLELEEITEHYSDVKSAIHSYFTEIINDEINEIKFSLLSKEELIIKMNQRLEEEEKLIILSILAAVEAKFRLDYLKRVYTKQKDIISREFRNIYKEKEESGFHTSFENDILDVWGKYVSPKSLIGDLKSAFKYRHWLAHGRFWYPKLGKQFDYEGIYALAQSINTSFPFLT